MTVTASAPGKLILLGEYAVLDGAPASVLAVDRRARVRIDEAANGWRLRAPQLGIEDTPLVADVSAPAGAESDPRLGVANAVLAGVTAAHGAPPPAQIAIETADFYVGSRKLGFGSSAAVAAALAGGLAAWTSGETEPRALFWLTLEAHRRAQGGVGSGIDVAASVFGGALSYCRDRLPEGLAMPAGIELCAVDAGQAASTPTLVRGVQELRERRPRVYARVLGRLADAAEAGVRALRGGDADALMSAAGAYAEGLRELGSAAGVDIVSAAHRQLAGLAAEHGVVYKPSGAGGGDLGLGFARSAASREAFEGAARRAGYVTLNVPLARTGLATTAEEPA